MANCDIITMLKEFGFPVVAFFVMVWILVYQRRSDMEGIVESIKRVDDGLAAIAEANARVLEQNERIMVAIHELAKQNNSMIQVLIELAKELGRRNGKLSNK